MNWFSGIVVFVMIWWSVFFCVLPFGVRHDDKLNVGDMPGAPDKADIKRKMLWTTLIAIPLFLGAWWLIDSGLISFRHMADEMSRT